MKANFRKAIFLCFLVLNLVSCKSEFSGKKAPLAKDGVIDLSDWDFVKDGPVRLDGDWKFFWNQLLDEESFDEEAFLAETALFPVPSVWNNMKNPLEPNKHLDKFGYASFALKILLPADVRGTAFRFSYSFSSYDLSIFQSEEFKEVLSNGKVAIEKKMQKPQALAKVSEDLISFIRPEQKELILVKRVSNFYYAHGGSKYPIYFAKKSFLEQSLLKDRLISAFLIGLLTIMAFYHLGLFLQRRADKASFCFSMACFSVAIRQISTAQFIVLFTGSSSPDFFEWHTKAEFISMYTSVLFFTAFLYFLAPAKWFLKITQLATVFVFGLSLLTLIFDMSFYPGLMLTIFQFSLIIFSIAYIFHLCRMSFLGNKSAFYSLLGFCPLLLAILNDILHTKGVIHSIFLAPYGFALFIFAQSYILSKVFSDAHKKAEYLSENLRTEVEKQTENLRIARNEALRLKAKAEDALDQLQETQGQLVEAEKMRSLGVMIAGVAHEINNPINAVVWQGQLIRNSLEKNFDNELKETKKTIRYVKELETAALRVEKIVKGLKQISRPDKETLEKVSITLLVENALSVLGSKLAGIKVNSNLEEAIFHEVFPGKLTQILTNLVDNAIDAVKNVENPEISVSCNMENSRLHLTVSDNGSGIPEEIKSKIFDPFFTSKDVNEGTGLGLSLSKNFAEEMGARLSCNSEPGNTNFHIDFEAAES